MQNEQHHQAPAPQIKIRVRLEPELDEIAALWPPLKRLELSRKLQRWSRQLRVSAMIQIKDEREAAARPRPRLRSLSKRKQVLN
jgi:hypothetical protein